MEISFQHFQWITLLSLLCMHVRPSVSQAAPQQNNNKAVTNVCGKCRPSWIDLLEANRFMLNVKGVTAAVCGVALQEGFVSACSRPHNTCKQSSKTKFCCCPMSNLSQVRRCLASENACVPDDIAPWQSKFQQAFFKIVGL